MFIKSIIIILSLLLASVSLHAAERLDYLIEYKGLLSGYKWTDVSRASIATSRLADCAGRGSCMVSTAKLSSKGYKVLEAVFKVRFHYSSYYQLNPSRTLAFETREKKYSKQYMPYGYKHSLAVIPKGASTTDYYKFGSKGEPLPAAIKPFVATDHKSAENIRVKKVKHKPVTKNSIDRMTLLQSVRSAPLKVGYKASFTGTDGRNKLEFRLAVVAAEDVKAAGRSWKTWKVRIDEIEKGEKPVSLYAWISMESRHIPVFIEIESSYGEARFHLKSF